MLIYNGISHVPNWYKNIITKENDFIRGKPVERTTLAKRIKLTVENKKFLKSLGFKL